VDTPKAPPKLGKAGRELWRAITLNWELDARELAQLAAICRQSDDVALLEQALASDGLIVIGSAGQPRMNGVVTELRQSRMAVSKMLCDLRLPAADGTPAMSAASLSAQKASNVRWDLDRERKGLRRG